MANEIKVERRALGELRAADGDKFQLCGYAARFGVLSKPMVGGLREIIQRGAFSDSLKRGDDVVALFNHDSNKVLGRLSAGTLEVSEDERGLKFCMQLDPNNTEHKNLYSACKRGDICECSFAFTVAPDGQEFTDADENGVHYILRTLRKVNLVDVSAVTYPAYPATSVDARAAIEQLNDEAWRNQMIDKLNRMKAKWIAEEIKGETHV